MAKFIKAPVGEEQDPTLAEQAGLWLSSMGIETGLTGAGLLIAGAVLLVLGLARLTFAVMRGALWHETEGEVVDAEPATGGGHNPVVVYRDRTGRNRRFLGELVTESDPTGKLVRVRESGGRPSIVAPEARRAGGLAGALVPLVLAGLAVSTGLTGRLGGIVALPWP